MENVEFPYEKLFVWREAKKLSLLVYKITAEFPREERFILSAQIKRAAASIANNLAEGSARESNKEKLRYIEIAYGSLLEVVSQLDFSKDLGFLSESEFYKLKKAYYTLSLQIYRYKKAVASRLKA